MTDLEARTATPLRPRSSARERFDHARALAMLGRTDEALDALKPIDNPGWTAEVEGLRGTIYETRGEWDSGLAAYHAAEEAWERRPPAGRAAAVLQLKTGIAYCLRKSGRYAEAESVYLEVLAQAPAARSHYLLAQFYEDAQQARKAQSHARRAIELAPDRYRRDGERLIQKMAVSQFGCLGVYDAENRLAEPANSPEGVVQLR